MYHDWSQGLWFASEWRAAPLPAGTSESGPCLVIGGGAFGDELKKLMETSSVPAKADELEAKIQGNAWKTVVFAETLVAEDPTAEGPAMAAFRRRRLPVRAWDVASWVRRPGASCAPCRWRHRSSKPRSST